MKRDFDIRELIDNHLNACGIETCIQHTYILIGIESTQNLSNLQLLSYCFMIFYKNYMLKDHWC